ncbi:MAG: hypothetical protein HC893_03670 [Chloroflexaceae bacterium]|nr:hypothetical protein [Chloroflexaceae bacterium]
MAQATYALRIADTQVDEADNDQTAEMVFTVTLAQPLPAGASITVEYTTIDGRQSVRLNTLPNRARSPLAAPRPSRQSV